jgi:dethiobiotin synthetase
MARKTSAEILFVTGTDTGVGKTVFTALLLAHLRNRGVKALALKPFCSGGRADAKILHRLQGGDLSLDEVNPFAFSEPVAPLVAARAATTCVPLEQVFNHVRRMALRCDWLLVEGAGGLLAPLGEARRERGKSDVYTARELIGRLDCATVVVACNRLGTINHTLLTVSALHAAGCERVQVAFMQQAAQDASSQSNSTLIQEFLRQIALTELPWLGDFSPTTSGIKRAARMNQALLERVLGSAASTSKKPTG